MVYEKRRFCGAVRGVVAGTDASDFHTFFSAALRGRSA